jgi:hypothetical protein
LCTPLASTVLPRHVPALLVLCILVIHMKLLLHPTVTTLSCFSHSTTIPAHAQARNLQAFGELPTNARINQTAVDMALDGAEGGEEDTGIDFDDVRVTVPVICVVCMLMRAAAGTLQCRLWPYPSTCA